MAEHDLSEIVVVGARVTYMLAVDSLTGKSVAMGKFPHCALWTLQPGASQCAAAISVTEEAGESMNERCTREVKHRGPHVVHAEPGLPVLAWLEETR